MRKSFKKVLCAVMAASMVFSTPIATNVVAQAATGEDGSSLTVPVTASTTLNDVVSDSKANGYQSKYSDLYGVEGNFDVTFTLTNVTSDMGNNWNAPDVDIRSAAAIKDADASLIAQYRPDNWLNKGSEITVNKGQWETDNATWMSNGEWNGYKGILKDAVAFVNVKKTDTTYEVTETFIGSATNTQYAGKKFEMNYVTTPTSMPETTYIDFTIDACTATVSHVSYATSSNKSIKANDAVALVTNGDKTAKLNVEVKEDDTVVPNPSVTYESSDEKIATVDEDGNVTAVADGTAVVRSTSEGVTANTVVLVTTKADSIKISGEAVENGKAKLEMLKSKKDNAVAPGSTTLTATVSPENAVNKDYEWTVNGTAVTVDANGVVKTADDAQDGDTAVVTATVKGTEISDSVEFTIGVKEVEAFIDPASVAVAPATVTANAGEEVKFTAAVYGDGGETLATNQGVTWSAKVADDSEIAISDDGVLTVPSDVKEGDKITVTATSKANGKVTGTATIKVHLYEPVTGTAWWNDGGVTGQSKDRILKDDGSVSFILENNKADTAGNIGFCVEAYAVNADGSKYVNNDVATEEKGAYITSSYNGKFEGWVAGIPAAKLGATGKTTINFAANPDNFYNISASKEAFLPEHNYKVTFTKKGNDYLILMKDLNDDTWFYRQMFKGAEMESDTLGIHFMAQLGTFNLVDTNDHLTTNTTDKPQVVRPKPNPGTPSPSPSPSPSNNNTNKNNTTNNNTTNNDKTTTLTDAKSTVKAAKITVKKGKKAVSKVTVKKGKKVTLKVSVNSKGKLSVAKLSKKAKKIAKVTLKKGKLTIKGKKKGKVTLKIKAAKTSKYKKATKSIKVTVK